MTAGLESNVQPRQLLCFIIFSCFLALNSQLARVTSKHPLPASNYKAHVFFDKEPLLRVVIRNSHELVKVSNPYILFEIYFIIMIEHIFINASIFIIVFMMFEKLVMSPLISQHEKTCRKRRNLWNV